MNFYKLRPEVAGNIYGQHSVIDMTGDFPVVTRLDYEFDGWSGDDLVTSFPCFIVTERLKDALLQISFTGAQFDAMTISKSEQFEEIYPNRVLPQFFWLKIDGIAGVADFGLHEGKRLVVSDRALTVLRAFQIDNCEVEEFAPDKTATAQAF